jgi:hypothetical protein
MQQIREEDELGVTIRLIPDGGDGFHCHRVSCSTQDLDQSEWKIVPPTVRIDLCSLLRPTPEQVIAYCGELYEVALVAQRLEDEMRQRFTASHSGE